jgi:DNA-directed RNA polymerase subunit F
MTNPQFIEEEALSLVDVKTVVDGISKRDTELGYLSNKAKEYLDAFVTLTTKKKNDLSKTLENLDLTRLKHEHIVKIVDFLPTTVDDLKVVLAAYPLSMPKKDQEAIVSAVKGAAET